MRASRPFASFIWEFKYPQTVQNDRHFVYILSRARIPMPTHNGCSAERESVLQAAGELKTRLTSLEKALQAVDEELNMAGSLVPNDTHPEAPIGPEENVCSGDRVVARGWCGNGTGDLSCHYDKHYCCVAAGACSQKRRGKGRLTPAPMTQRCRRQQSTSMGLCRSLGLHPRTTWSSAADWTCLILTRVRLLGMRCSLEVSFNGHLFWPKTEGQDLQCRGRPVSESIVPHGRRP
jgi:hypothetical protein